MSVIELDRRKTLTPEEALAVASRMKWDNVVICGYADGNDDVFTVVVSEMQVVDLLWVSKQLERFSLGEESGE